MNTTADPARRCRFTMIGGFLGAGKTTLIAELARRWTSAGKRVGIVTNDQADDLVDTTHLRSLGFSVGEVAGSCFCCNFDELIRVADDLSADEIPDYLLAEPVGSCTDLSATIIAPLAATMGDRFSVAPLGILLKTSHGRRILDADARSGFSPDAEYIFRKQLEEADYLMIGRADQLAEGEVRRFTDRLQSVAPEVPVIAVSSVRGTGIDAVMSTIDSDLPAGSRWLDIDYDT